MTDRIGSDSEGWSLDGRWSVGGSRSLTSGRRHVCYQISLGDTTGSGTPFLWEKALEEVNKSVGMDMIAVSNLYSGGWNEMETLTLLPGTCIV